MANHKGLANKASTGGLSFDGTPPWLSVMSEYNGELFDFMSRRFAKDARMMRELHECGSLSDVSTVQAKWLQETMRDYSDEATRLMALSLKQSNGAGPENRQ
jgi:hypothetical protein